MEFTKEEAKIMAKWVQEYYPYTWMCCQRPEQQTTEEQKLIHKIAEFIKEN